MHEQVGLGLSRYHVKQTSEVWHFARWWALMTMLLIWLINRSFVHIHSGNTSPIAGPSFDIGGYTLPIMDHVKELGGKVTHGQRTNVLDFGGNLQHAKLELRLR